MTVDIVVLLKFLLLVLSVTALGIGIVFLVEAVRIVINLRQIVQRLNLATDIRSWVSLIRNFSSSKKST